MSCDNELGAANTCVNSDAACSTCFDSSSFMDTFPADAENFFRSSLAFKPPTDPEFCVEANWRICKKFNPAENGEASCCCIQETKKYMACMVQGGWLPKYNIADEACIYEGCAIFDLPGSGDQVEGGGGGGGGDDDEGSMMIVIAGGAAGAVLIALLVICLYCRKKRLAAIADGDDDDDDEEKGKKGKKGKDKKGDKDKKDDKKDKKKDKEKKKDDSDDDDEDSDDKDSDDDDFDDKDVPNRIELPEKVVVVVVPPQLPSPWTPVVL